MHRLHGMRRRMSGARDLRGGRSSTGIHERHRVQFSAGEPNKGLGRGGNHGEKGSFAHSDRAKSGPWLLIRRNRLPAKIAELVVSDLPDQTAYRYSFLSFASLIPKSL